MADRIMVPFAGTGSGGELTWGQQHIWGAMQALGETMNMVPFQPLPPGATVEEAAVPAAFDPQTPSNVG